MENFDLTLFLSDGGNLNYETERTVRDREIERAKMSKLVTS